MNKARLAAVALGLLALGACDRSNEDRLNTVENEQAAQDLDSLSDQAANVAAESEALETQAANLQQKAETSDSATGAETPADENIAGM